MGATPQDYNITRWAGVTFNASKIRNGKSSEVRFKKQRDQLANWNEQILGKGFMHKYSGHELPLKTADLF